MTVFKKFALRVTCLSGVALLLAAPVRAQEITAAAVSAPSAQSSAVVPASTGPSLDAASVGVKRASSDAPVAAEAAAGPNAGRGTALMIVGGAAVITGIVIGNGAGYAISVAGAVVGLYGLYLYLQ